MQVENEHFIKKKCDALKHVRNKEQNLTKDSTQVRRTSPEKEGLAVKASNGSLL